MLKGQFLAPILATMPTSSMPVLRMINTIGLFCLKSLKVQTSLQNWKEWSTITSTSLKPCSTSCRPSRNSTPCWTFTRFENISFLGQTYLIWLSTNMTSWLTRRTHHIKGKARVEQSIDTSLYSSLSWSLVIYTRAAMTKPKKKDKRSWILFKTYRCPEHSTCSFKR